VGSRLPGLPGKILLPCGSQAHRPFRIPPRPPEKPVKRRKHSNPCEGKGSGHFATLRISSTSREQCTPGQLSKQGKQRIQGINAPHGNPTRRRETHGNYSDCQEMSKTLWGAECKPYAGSCESKAGMIAMSFSQHWQGFRMFVIYISIFY